MVGCFGGPVRHQVERLSTGWACESGAQGWVGLEKKFPGCPGEANIVHGEPRVHGLWLWFPKVSPQHLSQPPLGWGVQLPPQNAGPKKPGINPPAYPSSIRNKSPQPESSHKRIPSSPSDQLSGQSQTGHHQGVVTHSCFPGKGAPRDASSILCGRLTGARPWGGQENERSLRGGGEDLPGLTVDSEPGLLTFRWPKPSLKE